MTHNLVLSLGAQRNEDYGLETWRLSDNQSGDALDITGWSFEFRIAPATGQAAVLVVNGTANTNGSYVAVSEGSNGLSDVFIAKEDIAELPGLDIDVCVLAYNLIMTDGLASQHAYVVGPFTVRPGV